MCSGRMAHHAVGIGLIVALACLALCAQVPSAAAQSGTPTPTIGAQVHVVQAGEYLSVIAARYGITAQELADANNMSLNDILQIGRELIIPGTVAEPTATLAPTASPTPEGGRIIVTVFEDSNGNGVRDAGEPDLAGAQIVLLDADGETLREHTSDGTTEPYTFEALPPATYTVREEDPKGYSSTSANSWSVPLGAVAEMEVFFADRPAVAPSAVATSPADEATNTATDGVAASAGGIARYSGIIVAVVALGLPFGLRALRGRQ